MKLLLKMRGVPSVPPLPLWTNGTYRTLRYTWDSMGHLSLTCGNVPGCPTCPTVPTIPPVQGHKGGTPMGQLQKRVKLQVKHKGYEI